MAAPGFADRSAQLIADFQHAMDSAAPVTGVLMDELKAVLDIGVQCHADCEAMRTKMSRIEADADDIAKTMSS